MHELLIESFMPFDFGKRLLLRQPSEATQDMLDDSLGTESGADLGGTGTPVSFDLDDGEAEPCQVIGRINHRCQLFEGRAESHGPSAAARRH